MMMPILRTVKPAMTAVCLGVALLFVSLSLILPPHSDSQAQELTFSRAVEEAAGRLAEAFPMLRGVVVQAEGDRVLIDLGTKQKVYQGMELQVYREGDEVKHPVTGLVLGRRDKRLGLIRVVEVNEGFSEAAVVTLHDGATITTGDLVRVSHDRLSAALPMIDRGEFTNVDVQSITKDLAIALAKSGRFYVIEDHLVRAALMGEGAPRIEPSGDPAVLKLLAEKARAQLLILGRLSPAEQGAVLNIQVVSVSTGSPLTVASVDLPGEQPRALVQPSVVSAPPSPGKGAPAFVRVQPQTPSEQPKSPPRGIAPVQRVPVSAAPQQMGGAPSFLVKGDEPPGRPGDQTAKDQLTFELADSLLAVAAGDLDGDRRSEVVGMTASDVIVYRWRDRQLLPVARFAAGDPVVIRLLHLDVGDVNGSGSAQVFVTALSSVPEGLKLRNALRSFVLEFQGDKLVKIADGLDYFLRVLTGPGIDAPILIGQRMGDEKTPFEGPIVRLAWGSGRYVQDAAPVLPPQIKGLYDFAPIEAVGNQIVEVAVITEEGRIKILGTNGTAPWEGKDNLGEVDHLAFYRTPDLQAIRFPHGIRSGIPVNPEEYADRSILPRRVLVQSSPLWGDAKAEILTLANSPKYGLLGGTRRHRGGSWRIAASMGVSPGAGRLSQWRERCATWPSSI